MYIVSDKKKENPGLLQLEIFQQVKGIKTVSQDLCRDEEERERLGRRIWGRKKQVKRAFLNYLSLKIGEPWNPGWKLAIVSNIAFCDKIGRV